MLFFFIKLISYFQYCCINILASVEYTKAKKKLKYRMKDRERFRLATKPLGRIYSVFVKEYAIGIRNIYS